MSKNIIFENKNIVRFTLIVKKYSTITPSDKRNFHMVFVPFVNGYSFLVDGKDKYDLLAYDIFYVLPGQDLKYLKDTCSEIHKEKLGISMRISSEFIEGLQKRSVVSLDGLFTEQAIRFGNVGKNILRHDIEQLLELMESCMWDDFLPVEVFVERWFVYAREHLRRNNIYINGEIFHIPPRMQPVVRYICEHCSEELSLETLARQFHWSPSYLSRIFKQELGISYTEFLRDLRLRLAKNLICAGNAAAVASEMAGFRDYSTFYRIFKKQFGISPSDFYLE